MVLNELDLEVVILSPTKVKKEILFIGDQMDKHVYRRKKKNLIKESYMRILTLMM